MLATLARTPVSEVPQREAVVVNADVSLKEAVERMRGGGRGAVVVRSATGHAIGILTQRDLVTRVALDRPDWGSQPISEVMTPEPTTIGLDAPLAHALRLMDEGGFRGLPVVDNSGHAVGVISIRDILRHITESFPAEFVNLPPDPAHEARGRWGG